MIAPMMTEQHWDTLNDGMTYAVFGADGVVETLRGHDQKSPAFEQTIRDCFSTNRFQDLSDDTITLIAELKRQIQLDSPEQPEEVRSLAGGIGACFKREPGILAPSHLDKKERAAWIAHIRNLIKSKTRIGAPIKEQIWNHLKLVQKRDIGNPNNG